MAERILWFSLSAGFYIGFMFFWNWLVDASWAGMAIGMAVCLALENAKKL